ncbi:hypothetical protein [Streptomyces lydicus]|uniref:hypothetical protein n=1 Tax=Streptomyces lydicus TaxID=47763 RepID=UPI0037006433
MLTRAYAARYVRQTCRPRIAAQVRAERGNMARHLITHTYAERERALAEGTAPPHATWEHTADALTDALVGLLTAPVTPPIPPRSTPGPEDHRGGYLTAALATTSPARPLTTRPAL